VLLKPMTGRRYYITTLADFHRNAHRFANSHWLALGDDDGANASRELADTQLAGVPVAHHAQPRDSTRIIVLIDAAEAVARVHPLLRPRVF
jgi:hypothetical protein